MTTSVDNCWQGFLCSSHHLLPVAARQTDLRQRRNQPRQLSISHTPWSFPMKTIRNMKLLKHLSGILIALAALFCAPAMHAQTVTGTITGTVTDPSGAVVAGASVLAHNTDTGVDSTVTTNSTGLYRIQFLPIGRYEVTVEAKGFDKETIPAFQLEVLQTVTFNVKLSIGSSAEVVNVSEAAPILNTSDATLSGTFTTNTIQNFPLNGLDFSALTLYIPGSVSTVGTSGTTSIERSTQY